MTWLYVPQTPTTSSNCAPASADSVSLSTLPNLERVASLTLRGKHSPPRHWLRVWKAATWLRRLSGLTLPHSTLEAGVAAFIASLPETHVRETASPESGSESSTNDSSSTRSFECSMKAGLIVSSARTSQGMRTDNLLPSSPLWSGWVAALRLESSRRPRSAQAIAANGSLYWPTARAEDAESSGMRHSRGVADTLTAVTRNWQDNLWPTTTAQDSMSSGNRAISPKAHTGTSLADAAVRNPQWSTPKAISGGPNSKRSERGAGGPDLQEQVTRWPTPVAAPDAPNRNSNTVNGPTSLGEAARAWPTPRARDHKGSGTGSDRPDGRSRMDQLDWAAEHWRSSSRQGLSTPPGLSSPSTTLACYRRYRATTDSVLRSEIKALLRMGIRSRGRGWTRSQPAPFVRPSFRRQLTPLFTEKLMGWPTGWTDCEPVETGLSRWLERMRSLLFALCSTPADEEQPSLF